MKNIARMLRKQGEILASFEQKKEDFLVTIFANGGIHTARYSTRKDVESVVSYCKSSGVKYKVSEVVK